MRQFKRVLERFKPDHAQIWVVDSPVLFLNTEITGVDIERYAANKCLGRLV